MTEQEKKESLLGFNWEDDGEDFFSISGTTEEATTETEEEVVETPEGEATETTEESEETVTEDENAFFGNVEDPIEEEGDEVGDSQPDKTSVYNDLFKDLKEKGIFKHVDLEEGEELDPDKLFELQEQDYEAEVSARLTAWATQDLDEDAQAFIKFKKDGGDTKEFFETYSRSTDLPIGDISEETHQDKVIRYQLREEGWDSEEIEDRLEYLTSSGKKEQVAKRYNVKIKEKDAVQKEEALQKAERAKEASIQQEQQFKENIKSVLQDTKEISGVKITDKDKTQLYNFLTKKSHKISDTKSVTGFQKKLGEAFQDTDKMILLAKLVSSDFDMKDFEKAVATKQTRKVRSNLEQRKDLRPTNSGSSLEGNRLADLFN